MPFNPTRFLEADAAHRDADRAIAARADRIAARLIRFPADYVRPAPLHVAGGALAELLDFTAWDIDRARGDLRRQIKAKLRARPAYCALVDARLAAIRGVAA